MSTTKPDPGRPMRSRRLSWAEYEQLTGRKKPIADNDNEKKEQQWKS